MYILKRTDFFRMGVKKKVNIATQQNKANRKFAYNLSFVSLLLFWNYSVLNWIILFEKRTANSAQLRLQETFVTSLSALKIFCVKTILSLTDSAGKISAHIPCSEDEPPRSPWEASFVSVPEHNCPRPFESRSELSPCDWKWKYADSFITLSWFSLAVSCCNWSAALRAV